MYQHPVSRNPSPARNGARGFTLSMLRASTARRRREHLWAWVSLLLLILCWDASLRMDQKVPMPRPRLAHLVEPEIQGGARIEQP